MPMNWTFDHSYARLPEHFYTRLDPTPVQNPELVVVNHALADDLGLTLKDASNDDLAAMFSGNTLPAGAKPIAQAYAGHQFGHFTMLGDGRAHLLGEHLTLDGTRVDIQLKGSGQTPYARRGDGRAALGPMLREYVISEAMHALHVPTTRSLAVVTTGEPVYRETMLQGAILTRVASSHLRIGTFEYVAAQRNISDLKQLADYAIDRHDAGLKESKQPYLEWLKVVMERQIALVVDWLRVGFIHGVMNTDNVTLAGETMDYGPCAFMDKYDPQTVFSSIDQMGRYAYANQPRIVQWNMARFAEALLPLLHEDIKQGAALAEEVIHSFQTSFQRAWLAMMRRKLGLFGAQKEDEALVGDILQWMQRNEMDYTNTFRALASDRALTAGTKPEGEVFEAKAFQAWWRRWQERLQQNSKPISSSLCLMRANNPAIIPRNHKVEEALTAAEELRDFSVLHRLLAALAKPYQDHPEYAEFQTPPTPEERVYQTFCGT